MSDLSTGLSDSIVRFYRGDGQDDKGRTLHEILAFTDQKLESQHDYIQVLFPVSPPIVSLIQLLTCDSKLPESSLFHPTAPILTKTTRDVFASDEKLQDELYESFIRLANLYAFDVSGPKSAVHMCPKSDFQRLARVTWLKRVDHNHLRISRIIRYDITSELLVLELSL
jgi:hypothetical protein